MRSFEVHSMAMHAKAMTWNYIIPRQQAVHRCSPEQSRGALRTVAFWQLRERAHIVTSSQQVQQDMRRNFCTAQYFHRGRSLSAVMPTLLCKSVRLRPSATPKHNPQNVPDPEVSFSSCHAPLAAHPLPSLQCSFGRESVQHTIT